MATESTEHREARLLQLRVYQHETLPTESTEQREARLLQLRVYQHETLPMATESTEQREARLLHLRNNQQARLATESTEQRSQVTVCKQYSVCCRERTNTATCKHRTVIQTVLSSDEDDKISSTYWTK